MWEMNAIGLFCCLAALATITSGVKIQCIYSITNWGDYYGGVQYTCRGTVISEENPLTFTDISGTHLAGKREADVKAFWVDDSNTLTKIPNGLENFFPDLEIFDWYGGVSSIDSSTFKPFPNLLRLNFYENKIATLDSDLFKYTRKLRLISFYHNLLRNVGNDLLTGLTELNHVEFRSNPCINAFGFTPQAIQGLKSQLSIKCPPFPATTTISTTSEPNECPISCTRIEEIERRLSALENSSEEG